MQKNYYEWYSERVGMNLGVLRYGHWGPALIYFPTCGGDHREFDRYGMHWDAKKWIDEGKVQIFAVDGINHLTYYNRSLHPKDKIKWAMGYEGYILEEIIPLVKNITGNNFLGCMGASFGGYTVSNYFFKHPGLFDVAVSMSGVFSMKDNLYGYYDKNAYFNNPVDFVPNINDAHSYNKFNNESTFWMFCGENDICRHENEDFHNLLNYKGIRHWYDRWNAPCDHHEYWWKKQLPVVLNRFYNW